jgi:hypothetical protein
MFSSALGVLGHLLGSENVDEPLSPAMKSDLARLKADQRARRQAAGGVKTANAPASTVGANWRRKAQPCDAVRLQTKQQAKLSRKERMAQEKELAVEMARMKSAQDNPLQEHLRRVVHTILDGLEVTTVIRQGRVVTIDSGMGVKEAFQKLLDNNILSAPVWDPGTNNYVGYLNLADLVTYILILEHEDELKALGGQHSPLRQ